MNDKVIAFPGVEPLPENPLAIAKPASHIYCRHEQVSLDEHNRVVLCAKCGATLDPFNFLQQNARTIQTAWDHHRMVMAKVHEIGTCERCGEQAYRERGSVRAHDAREAGVLSGLPASDLPPAEASSKTPPVGAPLTCWPFPVSAHQEP